VWFGEDQGRYVLAISPASVDAVLAAARDAGVPARLVGRVGGDALKLPGEAPLSLAALRAAHGRWLPELMAAKIG
jgi:phosphoribosylformylglycinamidine synthase